MNLLRFTAAWTGMASAFLYVLGFFFWEDSWLAIDHPWARWLPFGVALLLSTIVAAISGWRLMSRTLPPGGPDLFKWRFYPPHRFADGWEVAFLIGIPLSLFMGVNEFVGMAGASLMMAGMSQAFWPVYEEGPDA